MPGVEIGGPKCYRTITQPYMLKSAKCGRILQITRYRPASAKVPGGVSQSLFAPAAPRANDGAPATNLMGLKSSIGGTGRRRLRQGDIAGCRARAIDHRLVPAFHIEEHAAIPRDDHRARHHIVAGIARLVVIRESRWGERRAGSISEPEADDRGRPLSIRYPWGQAHEAEPHGDDYTKLMSGCGTSVRSPASRPPHAMNWYGLHPAQTTRTGYASPLVWQIIWWPTSPRPARWHARRVAVPAVLAVLARAGHPTPARPQSQRVGLCRIMKCTSVVEIREEAPTIHYKNHVKHVPLSAGSLKCARLTP
jgi:hypothetical protein